MCGLIFSNTREIEIDLFEKSLNKIEHRGPDDSEMVLLESAALGFKRLAIMDPGRSGDQPFRVGSHYLVCNGEIYNYKELKKTISKYDFYSQSDCEFLLPYFLENGLTSLLSNIDGEFAFVIYDDEKKEVIAARDPIGIRPLFYAYASNGEILFASEAKALIDLSDKVYPFPPGHYYLNGNFHLFCDSAYEEKEFDEPIENFCLTINKLLTTAVEKRLNADAPIGFLLSGGLDSSLVCAIAQRKIKTPIRTFAIGMKSDAIDLKYAQETADFINANHTSVVMTPDEVIKALPKVIYHLESWDITTVRASVGMYLVCEYIRKNTDIKVLLTGEVSDEIFGYKYTDFAPSAKDFQEESNKRLRELYLYDVLRADRCISAHSIEARVPFSDKFFVKHSMNYNPARKMNCYGHGKYLLRKAFEGDKLLPESILFREKAAFSDAVGHSMVDYLKAYAEEQISDKEMSEVQLKFSYRTPFTKESYLYRKIFNDFYPNSQHLINDYWMPNQDWLEEKVSDPSARVLANYGKSGE